MGRKKATGKFDTRDELEECIWTRWRYTNQSQTEIAKLCKVSETTVANILKEMNYK